MCNKDDNTPAIEDLMNGTGEIQRGARLALPILVKRIKDENVPVTITYGDLAPHIGNPIPQNVAPRLFCMGEAIRDLWEQWNIVIPPIECIVIRSVGNQIGEWEGYPGSAVGLFYGMDHFNELTTGQRTLLFNDVLNRICTFPHWDKVITRFGLTPS